LYITSTQLCFYSTFPTKEIVQIDLTDIAILLKKKTAKLIPNAIELGTKGGERVSTLVPFWLLIFFPSSIK
jgi:hypothetical protein